MFFQIMMQQITEKMLLKELLMVILTLGWIKCLRLADIFQVINVP